MADAEVVDQDSLISQFISIAGVDSDRGKLYLESSGWNLDLAIASYFEEADEQAEELSNVRSQLDQQIEEPASAHPQRSSPNLFTPPEEMDTNQGRPKKQPARRTGINTLNSLQQNDSSDEEEGQAFYAGGSERSGQQIIGPPGSRRDPEQIVQDMFKAAKAAGGKVVDPSEMEQQQRPSAFRGHGFRLGTEPGEGSSSSAPEAASSLERPAPVHMVLRLWQNGFTVDDGELRAFDDPANADFLSNIKAGTIPRELILQARGGEVNLNMEDHRGQEFVPTKPKAKPFVGEGHRLGSVAPAVETAVIPATPGDEDAARQALKVDEAKPVTSIQVRLADGTRLVVKVNLIHTVAQLRQFICTARPATAARPFVLMTTFPNKELTEEEVTIESANLQNAVIVQRFN
jgi:UBX domain-containing protein 1